MPDRLDKLEGKLGDFTDLLQRLAERVAALEAGAAVEAEQADSAPPEPRARAAGSLERDAGTEPAKEAPDDDALDEATATAGQGQPAPGAVALDGVPLEGVPLASVLSALGRTFLVLGGAFLLRAVTDTGSIPKGGGVAVGIAYAVVWLAFASRAAATEQTLSAAFHGVTACIIAYPLIWEATTGFEVLSVHGSVGLIIGFAALSIGVAYWRRLPALAWTSTLSALITAVGLAVATQHMVDFAGAVLVLAIGTLWLGNVRYWHLLRWPGALVGALVVVLAIGLVTLRDRPPEAYGDLTAAGAMVIALALLVAYLVSFVIHTLVQGKQVGVFEAFQTAAVLIVGLGGAARLTMVTQSGRLPLGIAALVVAVASYAVAYGLVQRRQGAGVNYAYFTCIAVVTALGGGVLVVPGDALAFTCGIAAIAAALLGVRFDRMMLRAHSAAYLVAAALATGLVPAALDAIAGAAEGSWRPLTTASFFVIGAAVACYVVLAAGQQKDATQWVLRLPRFFVALVAICGVAALAITFSASMMRRGPHPEPASLAALRTAVLATAAVVLAGLGSTERLRELRWLMYPILIGGGFKLIAEDLRRGDAVTLFVGFAFFGAALIVAPRLARPTTDRNEPGGQGADQDNPSTS